MAVTVMSPQASLPSSARSGYRMATTRDLDGTFVVGAASLMADASSMPLTIVAPPSVLRCSSAKSTSRRGSSAMSMPQHHPKPPAPRSGNVESKDLASNHAGDHQPELNPVRLPRLALSTASAKPSSSDSVLTRTPTKPSSSDSVLTRTPTKVDNGIASKSNMENPLKESPRHTSSVFPNFRVLQRLATSARLRSAKKNAITHLNAKKAAERNSSKQDNSSLDNTEKLQPHAPSLRKAFDKVDHDSGVSSLEYTTDTSDVHGDDCTYHGTFIVSSGAVESASSTPQRSKRAKKKRPISVKIKLKRRSNSRRTKCSTPVTSTIQTSGNIAGATAVPGLGPMMMVAPAKVEIYSSRYNKNKKGNEQKNTADGVPQGSRSWSNNDSSGGVTLRKSLEMCGGPVTMLRTFEPVNTASYGTSPSLIKEPPTWNAKKKGVIENKVTKIFLSEKQSSSIKDCGKMIPCAPPVTPMPEMLNNVEFVPSLSDLRSQRAIKNRLVTMENEAKERRQKRLEESKKQEKQLQRDHVALKKYRQRQEIYALNKVMTQLENKNFQEFCKMVDNVKEPEKDS